LNKLRKEKLKKKLGKDVDMRIDEDAEKIWFIADTHFLHPRITHFTSRPVSAEDHDEWLLSRINERVGKKDTLYVLGDVSMGNKSKTEKILDRMNGIKTLILGNHDRNIEHSTRFANIYQIKNFTFDSPSYRNVHIVLCHFPLLSWERKSHGSYHLFGHVHGRLKGVDGSFDIGVDCNDYYPLNLSQVLLKLKSNE
jgi:calcineurin-like phosphoesterase family protein